MKRDVFFSQNVQEFFVKFDGQGGLVAKWVVWFVFLFATVSVFVFLFATVSVFVFMLIFVFATVFCLCKCAKVPGWLGGQVGGWVGCSLLVPTVNASQAGFLKQAEWLLPPSQCLLESPRIIGNIAFDRVIIIVVGVIFIVIITVIVVLIRITFKTTLPQKKS